MILLRCNSCMLMIRKDLILQAYIFGEILISLNIFHFSFTFTNNAYNAGAKRHTNIDGQNMVKKTQTLAVGYLLKTLKMAISAAMVFPEPVGAPSNTLLSVW